METTNHKLMKVIRFLNILFAIQGFIVFIFLLFDISETKNAFFFWYSKQRFLLLLIFFLITVFFIVSAFFHSRNEDWTNKFQTSFFQSKYFPVFVIFLFVILFSIVILYSIPPDTFPYKYHVYFDRLIPVFLFISISIIEIFIAFYIYRNSEDYLPTIKSFLKSWTTRIFLFATLVFVVTILTCFGNRPDPISWRQLGSPLFLWQIALSIIIGGILGVFETKYKFLKQNRLVDIFLIICLFFIAVSAWLSLPLQKAYTAPIVRPPNMEVYPYSDALFYSLSAESILSGYGIDGSTVVPRPLFITELAYVFKLADGNYSRIIFIQTFILALIPILLFLIGKDLHSRYLGITLALLSIFREYVGI